MSQYPPVGRGSSQYPPTNQYPPPQYSSQPYQSPQSNPSGNPPPFNPNMYSPPINRPQYPPTNQYPPPAYTTQQYPPTGQYAPTIGGYGNAPPYAQQYQPQAPPQSSLQQGWYSQFYNQLSPQELSNLQVWFTAVDRDRSGTITADELATLAIGGQVLGWDTARMLIKVFDKDNNGQLDFMEFASLHKFLTKMQAAFYAADRDRSGYLDIQEIYNAFVQSGFPLSYQTIQAVCQKFDYIPDRGISFPSFLKVCAHLSAVRSIFDWNDINHSGKVTFNYDQLAHVTIHLLPKGGI